MIPPRICHELNNLLTAILGNAELALMESQPSSSVYRSLDQIYKSAARAAELLGNSPVQHPTTGEGSAKGASQLILIADDDEAVREASRRLLEHAGHRVIVAQTGDEALELMRTHSDSLSVLILDWALRGLNGSATLRAAKELCPGMKTFLWSAAKPGDLDDIVNDLEDVEYLERPSHLPGIAQVLSRLVDSNQR